ncbi:MAG TPA: hypothetical protein VHG71_06625 [Verrucomicrobiae bacterium]|nr:hypothetical protein [Verrucomicrobiae bacterium]
MAQEAKTELPKPLLEALAKGRIVFYGEFRRGQAVEFSSKGGKVYHQTKCTVETDTGTITVTEFMPDGVDWQNWKAPFTRGQMVYGVCRTVEEQSGVQVTSAKLYAV